MAWWLWIVAGLALLVVEMATSGGLFALFFGFGALVVGVLALLGVAGPAEMQWLLFSALSVVALLCVRRRLRARLVPRRAVGSLVGEAALPLEDLAPHGTGKVELRGTSWEARNTTAEALARGRRCVVERLEGLMVWIRPE